MAKPLTFITKPSLNRLQHTIQPYMDASEDARGAQLSQEYNGAEFPIAFLSHTFTETQRKWSTPEQDAYGVYYAITKWNYCLQ